MRQVIGESWLLGGIVRWALVPGNVGRFNEIRGVGATVVRVCEVEFWQLVGMLVLEAFNAEGVRLFWQLSCLYMLDMLVGQ